MKHTSLISTAVFMLISILNPIFILALELYLHTYPYAYPLYTVVLAFSP